MNKKLVIAWITLLVCKLLCICYCSVETVYSTVQHRKVLVNKCQRVVYCTYHLSARDGQAQDQGVVGDHANHHDGGFKQLENFEKNKQQVCKVLQLLLSPRVYYNKLMKI